jgi:hypothetical protein
MSKNKHIQSFNEHQEKLDMSDVSKCFEKIKYFMNSISKKYYRNNNVIFKDMIVYRFSNDKDECENCELSVFNKIKINYINNIKTYKYLIKLKSDIIMSSYFDAHSGVDKNFHRYINIEHIIEYNRGAYSNDEILLFKKYLSNILTITEYKKFEEIFKKIGIGKNHQHNELITNKNKILKIFKIDGKKEIIDELKNNIY